MGAAHPGLVDGARAGGGVVNFICGTCMRVVGRGFAWHCGCGGHHALTVAVFPLTGQERPRAAVRP